MFTNLRIIKIQNLFTYVCSIIIYKLIRGIFPLSFASTIDLRLVHHNVNTRSNRSKYYVPFCRTSLRQRSLSYSLPKLTNEFFMPHNLDVSTSIFDLKKKLRLFLTWQATLSCFDVIYVILWYIGILVCTFDCILYAFNYPFYIPSALHFYNLFISVFQHYVEAAQAVCFWLRLSACIIASHNDDTHFVLYPMFLTSWQ